MKTLVAVIAFSFCLLLGACHGTAYYEHVCEAYVLHATDTMYDLRLGHEAENGITGIVPSTVVDVACQGGFIIVKQHPREFPDPPDRSVTNFYIIAFPDGSSSCPNEGVEGPLTETEFLARRVDLGVPASLEFTKMFPRLE